MTSKYMASGFSAADGRAPVNEMSQFCFETAAVSLDYAFSLNRNLIQYS